MERLFFLTKLHGKQFFIRKLSALEQLKISRVAIEIFHQLVENYSLDFTSLWASANNSALIYLALFSGDSEESAKQCFLKPLEVVNVLGLDEIAQLTDTYNLAFSEISMD